MRTNPPILFQIPPKIISIAHGSKGFRILCPGCGRFVEFAAITLAEDDELAMLEAGRLRTDEH